MIITTILLKIIKLITRLLNPLCIIKQHELICLLLLFLLCYYKYKNADNGDDMDEDIDNMKDIITIVIIMIITLAILTDTHNNNKINNNKNILTL